MALLWTAIIGLIAGAIATQLGFNMPAMTLLLRLSVLLHRGRSTVALPPIKLIPRNDALEIRFPPAWLDDHPLTVADLQSEIEHLKTVGFRLRVFTAR